MSVAVTETNKYEGWQPSLQPGCFSFSFLWFYLFKYLLITLILWSSKFIGRRSKCARSWNEARLSEINSRHENKPHLDETRFGWFWMFFKHLDFSRQSFPDVMWCSEMNNLMNVPSAVFLRRCHYYALRNLHKRYSVSCGHMKNMWISMLACIVYGKFQEFWMPATN